MFVKRLSLKEVVNKSAPWGAHQWLNPLVNLFHSIHLLPTIMLDEVSLPAGGRRLGHAAPQKPLLATDQYIWVRRVLSPSPLFLVPINLLSEILTCPLHSGSSTEVGVRSPKIGWDNLVEMEEKKEAHARQEEQQSIVDEHGFAKCQIAKCQMLEMQITSHWK